MELQHAWSRLAQAGVALFAVSYDAVPTLAAFADKRGITYPLLSDEGGHTIRALGLLNEHLAEHHAYYGVGVRDDQQGVPYPGTFVLDEDGVITGKHFEQSYRVRPTAALMEEWVRGRSEDRLPNWAHGGGRDVQVRAWSDVPTYYPYQQVRVHVRLELAPGVHVYGRPIPDGYTPLQIEVEPLDGLTVGSARLPAPRPMRVDGLDDAFVVHEGTIDATLPLLFTHNLGLTVVELRVRYQACTEATCFPPETVRLEVPLTGLDLIRD